jgi:iron complex outermembrane recepter protein
MNVRLPEIFSKAQWVGWIGLLALAVWLAGGPPLAAQETDQTKEQRAQAGQPDAAVAQEPAPEENRFKEEITVTGTRFKGRSATDTPAPVDYIDAEALRSTGATETGKALQLLVPSFNFSTTTFSSGSDTIRPATLRALGPDQVLVLINGKRRHQQALLNLAPIVRGTGGYDINTIPVSAIDHIEVLQDGASAQYGSDAIAGVINIILKNQKGASDLVLDAGQTYAGDGEVLMAGLNSGFGLGKDGFFNVTVEYRDRGETNRAGPDSLRVRPPRVTQSIGDPDAEDVATWLNTEIPIGNGAFYTFGGWSHRQVNSSLVFRSRRDGRTVPALYPDGFLPRLVTEPIDTSLVVGYRGDLPGDWGYDFGVNVGRSELRFRQENTVNVSYWYEPRNPADPTGPRFEESATAADTGTLKLHQTGLTFDLRGQLDWGLGEGPLLVAAGAEWRRDGFAIEPGEEVSYQYGRTNDRSIRILDQNGAIANPGTQGFSGWSPQEAIDKERGSTALYLDVESNLTSRFLAGAAVRFEDYSDFGSTVTGKLSGRVDFTDAVSLRGTVSTGFRAPGVQQEFYSQRTTMPNPAGELIDTLTARQDSAVARAFGIPALAEETSVNYSLGLVAKPSDHFRLTLDVYRIDIADRIVLSSNIEPESADSCGVPFDARRCPIRAILDPLGVGQIRFFTNAVDTETTGLDLVALYDRRIGTDSVLLLEGIFHRNETEVTDRHSSSSILPPEVLFGQAPITSITEGQPGERAMLSGTWYRGPWTTNLRFNYFGEVAGEFFTPGFKQTWGARWLTDLSIGYALTDTLKLTVGGLNIFDEYPDKWDPVKALPFPQMGFVYGFETLPFGINGGSYFARLSYHVGH